MTRGAAVRRAMGQRSPKGGRRQGGGEGRGGEGQESEVVGRGVKR